MSKSEERTAEEVTAFIFAEIHEHGPIKGTQLLKRIIRKFDCTWVEAELWMNARLMLGVIYNSRDDKIMLAEPVQQVLAECTDNIDSPEADNAAEVGNNKQPGGDLTV